MKVDVGVFAHNEAAGIAAMVARLLAQDVTGLEVRFLVLANGCSDATAQLAVEAGAEVADLAEGGKSRTWNRFVHDLSRPDAEALIFCDADIELPEPDMLRRLIEGLRARPALQVMNSRPVKDTVARPVGLGLQDRLIAMAAGSLDDWRTAICGQLYAMPAKAARQRWIPAGLPVEDGFLRAMILTDELRLPEDFSRIDGESVWHIYASERSVTSLIRHQIRIVLGSAINAAAFAVIDAMPGDARVPALQQAARDEGWLRNVVRSRLPDRRYGYVPLEFLVKRTRNLLASPKRLLNPKRLFLLIAGFGFDLVVYVGAQAKMARGSGVGYW